MQQKALPIASKGAADKLVRSNVLRPLPPRSYGTNEPVRDRFQWQYDYWRLTADRLPEKTSWITWLLIFSFASLALVPVLLPRDVG